MGDMDEDRKAPEQSAVVERTCRILHELARYGRAGARLVDLTDGTALTRPAALRILRTLCAEGLVEQQEGRRYFLGPAVYRMGLVATNPLGDIEALRVIVRDLASQAGDTAYLSMRQGDYCHYLLREEGAFPIRTHLVQVGDTRPLSHTYGGITLLSSMRPEEVDATLDRLARQADPTVRQRRDIIGRMLEQARALGYVSGADLVLKGVAGLGMSIPAADGTPFLALTISAITSRLEDDRLDEVRALVSAGVARIRTLLDRPFSSDAPPQRSRR